MKSFRVKSLIWGLLLCLLIPITVSAKSASAGETIPITISAAGDCTLGVDSRFNNSFNNYYNRKNAAYFLKKVKPVFEKDDVTIVNLEGTLTTSESRADKAFTFKGNKNYTKILKKGSVEVVTLANNHTMDFGKTGFSDTKKALKSAKISYCHYGTIAYKKIKGVKIAFLGFAPMMGGMSKEPIKKGIATAKKHHAKIIIVSFHWGVEKDYKPNGVQKSLGRFAIDQGASLVLGHHPHVLQGIEEYKNRYIVYSLGNFCFGGNVNPADKDTMIFQQTFYVKNGKLQKTKDARVIPCSLSSTKGTNDYQPCILKGAGKRRVLGKIQDISRGMHVSVTKKGKIK